MDILAYREESHVTVEVNGVIDAMDHEAVSCALRSHVETCEESELVVRLHDSIVTTAALRTLCETYAAARARGIALRVVVPPIAVRIFHMAGVEFLLAPEAYRGR
ncbi:STAS domain-containing protein [Streptomyces sp. NBC_01477]|uniref:STAS domain-containing protein n=1 Tax=Streptomyces sp. NBC_01477 TaxID=2976015 RepID=UPI002E30D6C3|nr:STAS domain-containing protein [Streptomyces sp. NBC_01477]